MAFFVVGFATQLVRSSRMVRAGIALPLLHLLIACVIAAAIYQVKETAFGLSAVSLVVAGICLLIQTKARGQGRLMSHLINSKATGEETPSMITKVWAIGAFSLLMYALMLRNSSMLGGVASALAAGVVLEFVCAATLHLRQNLVRA
jgi:hypothetical protein